MINFDAQNLAQRQIVSEFRLFSETIDGCDRFIDEFLVKA
jgi:hypothetical protein